MIEKTTWAAVRIALLFSSIIGYGWTIKSVVNSGMDSWLMVVLCVVASIVCVAVIAAIAVSFIPKHKQP